MVNQTSTITPPQPISSQASPAALYFVVVFLSFLSVIGTAGNALVLYVFCRKRDSLVSTLFILTLAVVDFVTCLVIVPCTVYMEYVDFHVEWDSFCRIYQFLITSSIPFSTLIMVAIAVDRYLCICHPLLNIMTIRRAKLLIFLLALISVVMGVCVALMFTVYAPLNNSAYNNSNQSDHAYHTRSSNSNMHHIVVKINPANMNLDQGAYRQLDGSVISYLDNVTVLNNVNKKSVVREKETTRISPEAATAATTITTVITEFTGRIVAEYSSHPPMLSSTDDLNLIIHTEGHCRQTDLVISTDVQYYYQKLYNTIYPACLVIIIMLYVLIYRSVLERRGRRQRAKSTSLGLVVQSQASAARTATATALRKSRSTRGSRSWDRKESDGKTVSGRCRYQRIGSGGEGRLVGGVDSGVENRRIQEEILRGIERNYEKYHGTNTEQNNEKNNGKYFEKNREKNIKKNCEKRIGRNVEGNEISENITDRFSTSYTTVPVSSSNVDNDISNNYAPRYRNNNNVNNSLSVSDSNGQLSVSFIKIQQHWRQQRKNSLKRQRQQRREKLKSLHLKEQQRNCKEQEISRVSGQGNRDSFGTNFQQRENQKEEQNCGDFGNYDDEKVKSVLCNGDETLVQRFSVSHDMQHDGDLHLEDQKAKCSRQRRPNLQQNEKQQNLQQPQYQSNNLTSAPPSGDNIRDGHDQQVEQQEQHYKQQQQHQGETKQQKQQQHQKFEDNEKISYKTGPELNKFQSCTLPFNALYICPADNSNFRKTFDNIQSIRDKDITPSQDCEIQNKSQNSSNKNNMLLTSASTPFETLSASLNNLYSGPSKAVELLSSKFSNGCNLLDKVSSSVDDGLKNKQIPIHKSDLSKNYLPNGRYCGNGKITRNYSDDSEVNRSLTNSVSLAVKQHDEKFDDEDEIGKAEGINDADDDDENEDDDEDDDDNSDYDDDFDDVDVIEDVINKEESKIWKKFFNPKLFRFSSTSTDKKVIKTAESMRLANLKTAAMLFVVTLVFVITFMPAFLIAVEIVPNNIILFYLYFANNVANPVIYSFMNRNFRTELKRLFMRKIQSGTVV